MANSNDSSLTYSQAGVDIAAGDALVDAIKPLAAATHRPGVMGRIGGFGALFDLKPSGFKDPVLVSGTDGVGTKLVLAFETDSHDTIGIDLVAMCVNDVLSQGAEPLFFLDYFATGRLDPGVAERVVRGIAKGCAEAGCALIGGETAEMPGMYQAGHYDLAGFVVGAAERDALLPNHARMQEGDVLIGLASSGPHSNGYSLIRRVVERSGLAWHDPAPFDAVSLGAALLRPTRLYVASLMPLIRAGHVKGLAHITGGGLTENLPRMCPAHLTPHIDRHLILPPPVFAWLADVGHIDEDEMYKTFNMGIGMVIAIDRQNQEAVMNALQASGEAPRVIGHLGPK